MLKRTTQLKSSKPLQRTGTLKKGSKLKKKGKTQEQKEIEQMTRDADRRFCIELWEQRGNKSEISGKRLPVDPNWACVHHIFSKAKYPVYRYAAENCILLTIEEHANVENNPTLYPEINRRKEMLKAKYGL